MIELVYGIHVVQSILVKNPKQILKVYIARQFKNIRLKQLIRQIRKCNIDIQECDRCWLNNKVKGSLHQGIVAKVTMLISCLTERDLSHFLMRCKATPLVLVLDRVTDPHNLGACLRVADAAGVHLVIVPKDHAVHINSTVRKVSSGAADRIPFMKVINLSRILVLLKKHNIRIIGTVVQSSCNIFDAQLIGPLALVMGSEGFGIRNLIKKQCDELISIPMSHIDVSLNISVATGICLFEVFRQRFYKR